LEEKDNDEASVSDGRDARLTGTGQGSEKAALIFRMIHSAWHIQNQSRFFDQRTAGMPLRLAYIAYRATSRHYLVRLESSIGARTISANPQTRSELRLSTQHADGAEYLLTTHQHRHIPKSLTQSKIMGEKNTVMKYPF